MDSAQIGGIVRALVAAVGGYFVGQGLVDAETVTTIGGAVATLAVAVWSIYAKRKSEVKAHDRINDADLGIGAADLDNQRWLRDFHDRHRN